jgi:hypothetical protein
MRLDSGARNADNDLGAIRSGTSYGATAWVAPFSFLFSFVANDSLENLPVRFGDLPTGILPEPVLLIGIRPRIGIRFRIIRRIGIALKRNVLHSMCFRRMRNPYKRIAIILLIEDVSIMMRLPRFPEMRIESLSSPRRLFICFSFCSTWLVSPSRNPQE